jgi:hypothetical protein
VTAASQESKLRARRFLVLRLRQSLLAKQENLVRTDHRSTRATSGHRKRLGTGKDYGSIRLFPGLYRLFDLALVHIGGIDFVGNARIGKNLVADCAP